MKIAILAAVIVLLILFALRFRSGERKRRERVFGLAMAMEESGDFEDACFHYAVAAEAGYESLLCREKIKTLWNSYGPFDFRRQLDKLKKDYCRDESCGTGYHQITVTCIRDVVGENRKKNAT
jgi:hypothetical protein